LSNSARQMRAALPGLFMLLLLPPPPGQAATLAGVVAEQGTLVAEAEVLLVNADTRAIIKSIYSAADGSFRFTVTQGTYNIGAQKPGYTLVWHKGIVVGDGDVNLHIEMIDKNFADGPPKAVSSDCE